MKILGIEVEDAYQLPGTPLIVRKNRRKKGKSSRSNKHPMFRISSRNLRTFIYAYYLKKAGGNRLQ